VEANNRPTRTGGAGCPPPGGLARSFNNGIPDSDFHFFDWTPIPSQNRVRHNFKFCRRRTGPEFPPWGAGEGPAFNRQGCNHSAERNPSFKRPGRRERIQRGASFLYATDFQQKTAAVGRCVKIPGLWPGRFQHGPAQFQDQSGIRPGLRGSVSNVGKKHPAGEGGKSCSHLRPDKNDVEHDDC